MSNHSHSVLPIPNPSGRSSHRARRHPRDSFKAMPDQIACPKWIGRTGPRVKPQLFLLGVFDAPAA